MLENQLQYNEALIDERDQGIAEIQQQIGEVNEIFQVSDMTVNISMIWGAISSRQQLSILE